MTQEKSPLPWYKEGLKFKCTECGKCCTGPSGYVFISEEEIVQMATLLKISPDLFKRKYTRLCDNRYALTERKQLNGDYDCVFLEGKKCTIYQARPKQCRTFPWWKDHLKSEESWKLAAQDCEGISENAPLISYLEILENLD